jgi:putative heme-binding domain-containing protein
LTPGFSPTALDQDHLTRFAELGLIPDAKPKPPGYAAETPAANDPLYVKAREYFNANCGTCHRFGGGGSVRILLDSSVKLPDMRIVNEPPLQGDMGLSHARLVAPGDPARSVILQRMATGGRGHMPYLGGRSVDDAGLVLIRDWIAAMPLAPEPHPQSRERREMDRAAVKKLQSDIGTIDEALGTLFITGNGTLELALALADGSIKGVTRERVIGEGVKLHDPLKRDLFERHLPASQRRRILGSVFDRAAVVAMAGDAKRGRAQFMAVCSTCHKHGPDGTDFGPDLSKIGVKYQRAALLEHIVEPAKLIEPAWQLVHVELKDGTAQMGFVAERNAEGVSLRCVGGAVVRVPTAQIANTIVQRVSLMPEGLLASLTAQEAADMLEFLMQK